MKQRGAHTASLLKIIIDNEDEGFFSIYDKKIKSGLRCSAVRFENLCLLKLGNGYYAVIL